jgi:D-sedoheptulose 7-phosphate isomerase
MNNIDQFFDTDAAVFATRYIDYLSGVLSRIDVGDIKRFVDTLLDAREKGATVFFIGNGGSAATASHFANDLGYGTDSYDKPFRALSLTDNQAVITALANDNGYDEVFVRQLRVLGQPGDVLVAISASGNSPNLIKAMEHASKADIRTVAITAFDGGRMKQIAEQGIHVPTAAKEYGPAEDAHMVLDHLIGAYLIRMVKQRSGSND